MRVIALEYHDIVRDGEWESSGFPGPAAASYKVSATSFRAHLAAVRSSKAAVHCRLEDASGSTVPTVVWTFDDGGAAFLSQAADLLEEHGWRGYLFMTTGQLGQRGFLDGAGLRELWMRGHTIGSHSCSHPTRFSALPADRVLEEWRSSITTLEDVLGAPVDTASVPGGAYSREVARRAAEAGVAWLFTSEPTTRVKRRDGCVIIGRYTLRRDHSAFYVRRLVGRPPLARAGQWLGWNVKKGLKSVGGRAYDGVRRRLLGT